MTVGSKVGFQDTVPLHGECEIVQETAATDVLTITGVASQTGDFLVCRNSAGTEQLSLSSSGVLIVTGTTSASAALTVGGLLTASSSAIITKLASCASALTVTSSAIFSSLVSCAAGLTVATAATVTSSAILSSLASVGGNLTVAGNATVTSSAVFSSLASFVGIASHASLATFAKSISGASSFGVNNATPVGKAVIGTTVSTTSGAYGFGSSAAFVAAITMLNAINDGLVACGLAATA